MNLIGAFKTYLTEQHLVMLLQALVTQIVQDTNDNKTSKKTLDLRQGKSSNKETKNKKLLKLRIARCWSIIRFLAEDPAIVYSDQVEAIALPLLQKIAENVDFDDDILFFVSSILKKRK